MPVRGAIGRWVQLSPALLLMQLVQGAQPATYFPPQMLKEVGLTSALRQPADKHLIAKGIVRRFSAAFQWGGLGGTGERGTGTQREKSLYCWVEEGTEERSTVVTQHVSRTGCDPPAPGTRAAPGDAAFPQGSMREPESSAASTSPRCLTTASKNAAVAFQFIFILLIACFLMLNVLWGRRFLQLQN